MKNFDSNDPKWTAYVLNELDARARAEVEAEINENPEARKLVEEIQQATGWLTSALANEPDIELNPAQKAAIGRAAETRPAGRVIRFPVWGSVALSAAAALVVAVLGIQQHLQQRTATEDPNAVAHVRGADVVAPPRGAEVIAEPADAPSTSATLRRDEHEAATASGDAARGAATTLENTARGVGQASPIQRIYPQTKTAERDNRLASASGIFSGRTSGGRERAMFAAAMPMPNEALPPSIISPSLDDFGEIRPNTFLRVIDHPLSTFSIDVDTASYSVVRKFLNEGRLPPPDAVRIEELINYFPYDYTPPTDGRPFAAHLEIAPAPWKPEHHLVRIALKGREIPAAERPALHLTYLIDVSGSMNYPNRLPLVKRALQALVKQLDERDRVAIVVYAGAAGLVLPPTSGADGQKILDAIERLEAGGSTAGGAGIQLAYATAREMFQTGAVNRVILCTDGDFNVGLTQRGDLERLIEQEAKSGVFLTVLGFGMGNYKDSTLEILSNKGNGNYAYIDDFSEARKVLVDQMLGTLVTIAKDVKIQVEFNPAHVAAYKLIGYENRMLKKEDFNNDKVDAGDIGAGHTVTAFYEIIPVGQPIPDVPAVDDLKYQPRPATSPVDPSSEMLTVKMRFKEPDGEVSSKQEFPLSASRMATMDATRDFRFAAAVAGFGLILRDADSRPAFSFDQVIALAESSLGEDRFGYRAEFLRLVRNAAALAGHNEHKRK
ncbi:MAG TPA: von Willebrand factor type A domain-containing protein [Kiritimatiellia bacterium]|nr:von Willebrand factor type A domain-containing protein [Kiritimatiellia bacterium]HMO97635.1 von Willebrand factor type A domain-containing protein [Kiritimatiellia bacterium]HMP97748.1 von Willebrand factor type A domain-containing protein [Kiritimatiellia bacterium]